MSETDGSTGEACDDALRGLTPLQRKTVDWAYERLKSGKVNRLLIADEVGLGKTLVAKGIIARLLEDHASLTVVYICSNASIADQNIAELELPGVTRTTSTGTGRLSMQHYEKARVEKANSGTSDALRLIPMTPSTSFNLYSNGGTKEERALLYAVLSRGDEDLRGHKEELALFLQGGAGGSWERTKREGGDWPNWTFGGWEELCETWARKVDEIEDSSPTLPEGALGRSYSEEIAKHMAGWYDKRHENEGENAWKRLIDKIVRWSTDYFDALDASRGGTEPPWKPDWESISELRIASAMASLDELRPDLAIMDEFQNFRSFLGIEESEKSDRRLLADKFLEDPELRIVLLSATPYRLYQTAEEAMRDAAADPHREFVDTISWLRTDSNDGSSFESQWNRYTRGLYSIIGSSRGELAADEIERGKEEEQATLRENMERSERTSTGELEPLEDPSLKRVEPGEEDVLACLHANDVLKSVGMSQSFPLDYLKSAPAPFSFMAGYKLKEEFFERAKTTWGDGGPKTDDRRRGYLWLGRREIDGYEFDATETKNSKFNELAEAFIGSGAHRLLWVPPSLPYYSVGEGSPFYGTNGFSKQLVFSCWAMVPRALSTLLSYQAERENRKALGEDGELYRYWRSHSSEADDEVEEDIPEEDSQRGERLPRRRLRFESSSGKPGAGTKRYPSAFAAVWPSEYLAGLFVPRGEIHRGRTLEEIHGELVEKIVSALADIPSWKPSCRRGSESKVDAAWYARAMLALDGAYDGSGESPAAVARGAVEKSGLLSSSQKNLIDDLFDRESYSRGLSDEVGSQSKRPADKEIAEVLAYAAIAAPGICALRTYSELGTLETRPFREAFEFGLACVSRFNSAAATLVIDANERDAPGRLGYIFRFLRYCADGNFQAMVDEYAHINARPNANTGKLDSKAFCSLHEMLIGAKWAQEGQGGLKRPNLIRVDNRYDVETYEDFEEKLDSGDGARHSSKMATNIAVGFTRGSSETGGNRRNRVRDAFNTPFRPFVLVSTSIGKEGLNFQNYCRKIVHWNLPSNPIDLEQREGRIDRYKSLAVRQNIASDLKQELGRHESGEKTVWAELFGHAEKRCKTIDDETGKGFSGLLPYWGIPERASRAFPIESKFYSYAFSSEASSYRRLRQLIAEYRMAMGQPDQDDFLQFLKERCREEELDALQEALAINLCPFVYE